VGAGIGRQVALDSENEARLWSRVKRFISTNRERVRDGAVSCSKGSEDNSTSLMLLTIMSEDVIYTVDVMNIREVKEEQVSR